MIKKKDPSVLVYFLVLYSHYLTGYEFFISFESLTIILNITVSYITVHDHYILGYMHTSISVGFLLIYIIFCPYPCCTHSYAFTPVPFTTITPLTTYDINIFQNPKNVCRLDYIFINILKLWFIYYWWAWKINFIWINNSVQLKSIYWAFLFSWSF